MDYFIDLYIPFNARRFLIISNSAVSDDGVYFLCGVSGNPAIPGCMKLESLFARSTAISENGIRLAIQCLKNLKYLDCKHLSSANLQLQSNRVLPPTTDLKTFHFASCGYLQLDHIVKFPYYTKRTTISNYGYVANLDFIDDVRMELAKRQARNTYIISNPSGIVSFLARFGKSIRKIVLQFIKDIDIFSIISTCPMLRSVHFFICDIIVSRVHRPPVSHNLQTCKISNGNSLGYDEIVYLLMSPNLRKISLIDCPNFCDEAIEAAFHKHRFRNLERLSIRNCHRVSKSVFSSCFISESNALTFIEINKCSTLSTLENQIEWLSMAASHNWDLQIIIK